MKKILVAEDEFDLLKSIEIILTEEGFSVVTAPNGREALKLLQKETPDLFITDVMMPHMSGLEVLEKMKDLKIIKPLNTIVMSAARFDTKEKGWKSFLPKPFTIEQLMRAVRAALKEHPPEKRDNGQEL